MSQYKEVLTLTARSTATVTAGRMVGYNGAQATVAGQACMGLANATVAANVDYPVIAIGTGLAVAGAAFAQGDDLSTDAQGRLITTVSPAKVVAYALTAATAANQMLEVLIK